jgi:hypothetical protein
VKREQPWTTWAQMLHAYWLCEIHIAKAIMSEGDRLICFWIWLDYFLIYPNSQTLRLRLAFSFHKKRIPSVGISVSRISCLAIRAFWHTCSFILHPFIYPIFAYR